jgi:hypothetical protein
MEKRVFCFHSVEAQAKRVSRLVVRKQNLRPTCRTRNVESKSWNNTRNRKVGPESVNFRLIGQWTDPLYKLRNIRE